MIWLYGIAAVLLLVKMLMIPTLPAVPTLPIVETLVNQSGIPNAVTAVILRNRLYDTIFEVVVFTLAIMGAQYLLSNEKPLGHVSRFNDQPSIVLARFGATICSLVCIELALRGHLSPGWICGWRCWRDGDRTCGHYLSSRMAREHLSSLPCRHMGKNLRDCFHSLRCQPVDGGGLAGRVSLARSSVVAGFLG